MCRRVRRAAFGAARREWEVAAAHVHLYGDVDVRVREVLAGAVKEARVQQLVQEGELRRVLELREAEVVVVEEEEVVEVVVVVVVW